MNAFFLINRGGIYYFVYSHSVNRIEFPPSQVKQFNVEQEEIISHIKENR